MKKFHPPHLIKIISRVLLIESLFVLSCIPVALYYNESPIPFLLTILVLTIPALTGFLLTRQVSLHDLHLKEGFLAVTLSWIFLVAAGSLPYLISGEIPGFIDALFESVSGFTTTGSSILTDIESLSFSILFWRSLTHWIGGLGIILLVIFILLTLNVGGYRLFSMESSLKEKFHSKIRFMGRRLLLIYIILTALEILFLQVGGMNLFESVCHSFGTVATGGFSPKNDSLSGYSPYIQVVVTIFMVLSGINFSLYYFMALPSWKKVLRNEELKLYLALIAMSGIVVTFILIFQGSLAPAKAIRDAFFQVVSIITCTGFATTDYLIWPFGGVALILFLMLVGGSTGSTSGGIKIMRHLLVFKNIRRSFYSILQPRTVSVIRLNKKVVSPEANLKILTFIITYIGIVIVASLLLMAMGIEPATSLGSALTTMGGIGPGFGTVGPAFNFSHLPIAAKLVLILLMLIGRLEIFTILSIFTKSFWKV